jgi:hypothetical protein
MGRASRRIGPRSAELHLVVGDDISVLPVRSSNIASPSTNSSARLPNNTPSSLLIVRDSPPTQSRYFH